MLCGHLAAQRESEPGSEADPFETTSKPSPMPPEMPTQEACPGLLWLWQLLTGAHLLAVRTGCAEGIPGGRQSHGHCCPSGPPSMGTAALWGHPLWALLPLGATLRGHAGGGLERFCCPPPAPWSTLGSSQVPTLRHSVLILDTSWLSEGSPGRCPRSPSRAGGRAGCRAASPGLLTPSGCFAKVCFGLA